MVLEDRELFHTGSESRGYCRIPSAECDRVMTKVLSGYGYARGALRLGTSLGDDAYVDSKVLAALELQAASAALPGGDMAILSVDALLGTAPVTRLRATLLDAENVFVCHDAQSGGYALPFVGMTTRHCHTDAVLGLDVRLMRVQWDRTSGRLLSEWLRAGPAFELLSNGLSQAHLGRSLVVGVPLDVQSRYTGDRPGSGTSLGASLRLHALYRTPQYEARLRAEHRISLAGGRGFAREHNLEAELRLVHNFFATDALVMQLGASVQLSWAAQPWLAQSLYVDRDGRLGLAAGLYMGWIGEAPGI